MDFKSYFGFVILGDFAFLSDSERISCCNTFFCVLVFELSSYMLIVIVTSRTMWCDFIIR